MTLPVTVWGDGRVWLGIASRISFYILPVHDCILGSHCTLYTITGQFPYVSHAAVVCISYAVRLIRQCTALRAFH